MSITTHNILLSNYYVNHMLYIVCGPAFETAGLFQAFGIAAVTGFGIEIYLHIGWVKDLLTSSADGNNIEDSDEE